MDKQQFIKEVGKKMRDGMCDLFVGAGMSAPSNVPTWRNFLESYLENLGLEMQEEDNLPLLAQYIVNSNSGNRNIISQAVYNTFATDYQLNPYHIAMSNFTINTIWTTNYDSLLEKAFVDRDIRVISSEDTLLHPHNNTELEIIKIHGCAKTATKGIILTRYDYDNFFIYET